MGIERKDGKTCAETYGETFTWKFSGAYGVNAATWSGGMPESHGESNLFTLDWSDHVDRGEVIELQQANLKLAQTAPVTATAESYAYGELEMNGDEAGGDVLVYAAENYDSDNDGSDFYATENDGYTGKDNLLHGYAASEASHSDTTNGVAGGGYSLGIFEQEHDFTAFSDNGIFLDNNDDHHIHVDQKGWNISDHMTKLYFDIELYGQYHEVEDPLDGLKC